LRKLWGYVKLARKFKDTNRAMIRIQREVIEAERPDRIVRNPKVVYPVLWSLHHPGHSITVSPVPFLHYVRGHAHLAFNGDYGPWLNRLTFALADFGLVTTIRTATRWLAQANGPAKQPPARTRAIKSALAREVVLYALSPALMERSATWPDRLRVVGQLTRPAPADWQPDPALAAFLDRYDKILLVTFGSMTNPAPREKTAVLIDILTRHGIPALINTAEGGLERPPGLVADHLHFVSGIPYGKILPRIYGVVHHGGAGTTHLALRYGCASLIIPHIIDQFVWNSMVAAKGAGPKGVPIGKMTVRNLEPLLLDLWHTPSYRHRAGELGAAMRAEDFSEEICRAILDKPAALRPEI
jgi:UDP:flavonoid glycosyltransferase YjiC (YdhE family)